jgi:hypothetical protein
VLTVYRPSREERLALQEREGAYHWSGCAETILRKHGLLTGAGGVPVVTRGAEGPTDAGCFEARLSPSVERALGVRFSDPRTVEQVTLLDEHCRPVAELRYLRHRVRRIPPVVGERSDPYELDDAQPVRVQALEPDGRWRPIAFVRVDDGDPLVAAVSDGRRLVLGLPLWDLIAHAHAFPALPDGYYNVGAWSATFPAERWLLDRILEHAPVIQVGRWPGGRRAALTIRHDYDRPIRRRHASQLLDAYDELGVRSTWFLLEETASRLLARRVRRRGHEVAVHTAARDEPAFRRELAAVERAAGARARGYSAHGGPGSAGFLGDVQYAWAERSGLRYGELLGRLNALPHRLLRIVDGLPAESALLVAPTHASFETSMEPGSHELATLGSQVPDTLEAGEHVVLMNHPDLNRSELISLLEQLPLRDVWCATLDEVLAWTDAAKYRSRVGENGVVEFGAPLPVETRVRRVRGGVVEAEAVCAPGGRRLTV